MSREDFDRTEAAALGGMLRWPDVIGEVVKVLRAADFRTDAHRRIFAALVALWDAGKPVAGQGGRRAAARGPRPRRRRAPVHQRPAAPAPHHDRRGGPPP